MSCGIGSRRGLDPTLLWLWCRPATVALIRPLAWEFPFAMGAALKKKKKGSTSNFFFLIQQPSRKLGEDYRKEIAGGYFFKYEKILYFTIIT